MTSPRYCTIHVLHNVYKNHKYLFCKFKQTDILDLNRLYKCNSTSIIWTEQTWNNGRFMWGSDCDIVGTNIRQVVLSTLLHSKILFLKLIKRSN